jgi:putative ABC transport system permease protein
MFYKKFPANAQKRITHDMNETLNYFDLVWSFGIIVFAAVLSRWQQLRLEGQLFYAAGRSLLQLLVVGTVIEVIFEVNNPIAVLAIALAMLTIAAIVARNRIGKQFKQLLPLVWGSLFISSALTLFYIFVVIVRPDPWYSPQYLIPFVGMILGNAMNGAALAGERLASQISQNRLEVETHLCLGATPQQAIASYRQDAIRVSLIPTLNQMLVVGIVSLPGMFTGQVLAGARPLEAASYQILILFAIALTNLLVAILVAQGVYRQFFNRNGQLEVGGK